MNRIEAMMRYRGLDERRLAALCARRVQTISQWLEGSEPRDENLHRLACALDCTMADLVEHPPCPSTFGGALRLWRYQNNVRLKVVAGATGITEEHLVSIENSKTLHPTKRTMRKLWELSGGRIGESHAVNPIVRFDAFRKALRARMNELFMTADDLAGHMDLEFDTVSRWTRGTRLPGRPRMNQLEELLDIKLEHLRP